MVNESEKTVRARTRASAEKLPLAYRTKSIKVGDGKSEEGNLVTGYADL